MPTVADAKLRPLLDAERLDLRVRELAAQVSEDYRGLDPVMVCVLKGSMPFFVDLTRAMSIPLRYEFLAAESYEGTESSGEVRITADLRSPIGGRHVILVEDIVDTGLTIGTLVSSFEARNPASLAVATLLDKPSRRKRAVELRYVGFEIPDAFVVGYGLDYEQYFRNLPYVAVLEEIPEIVG